MLVLPHSVDLPVGKPYAEVSSVMHRAHIRMPLSCPQIQRPTW
jgi:hypothetical protein